MTETPHKNASLTAHALLLMLAKTVGFVCSVALPLVLVRRLDQTQFGLYKQAFLIVTTAVAILPLGFGMCAYYYLPRDPERGRAVVLNILLFHGFTGALGLGALLLWPSLLQAIFHGPQLVPYGPRVGVLIFLWIVGAFLEIVPVARGELRIASALIIGIQVSRAALLLGAALTAGTLASLIDASILQGVLQNLVLLAYLRSRFRDFWKAFDWSMLWDQLSYSIPLGLGGLLFTLQNNVDNYVVSNRFGPAIFAIYSVGTLQLPFVGLLQEATNAVLIPRVSALQQQNAHREVVLLMTRAMRKLAAAYFAVYALMLVVGPEFIVFLFSPRYRSSWPIFAIDLTMLPMTVLLQDSLLRAYASERIFVLRYRFAMVFVLLAAVWEAAVHFGLLGAVSAVVAVGILDRLIIAIHFGRLLGVQRRDVVLLKDVGKLAACAAAAALATAAVRVRVQHWRPFAILMLCGVVFSVVYAAAVWGAGVIAEEERSLLRTKGRSAIARVRDGFRFAGAASRTPRARAHKIGS